MTLLLGGERVAPGGRVEPLFLYLALASRVPVPARSSVEEALAGLVGGVERVLL